MGLRDKLGTLKRAMRGNMDSFVLEDGTRFYFEPESLELFLFFTRCLRAQSAGKPYPAAPELVKALSRARNREVAYQQVRGEASWDIFPYEVEAFVGRGELRPRSLVYGRELSEQARRERGE